jgi:hypothetical protein
MTRTEQLFLNELHVVYPKLGDYWNEMFCQYLTVAFVLDDGIIALRKTVDVEGGYNYVLEAAEFMTMEEFRVFVEGKDYRNVTGIFVSYVVPECRKSIAADWAEFAVSVGSTPLELARAIRNKKLIEDGSDKKVKGDFTYTFKKNSGLVKISIDQWNRVWEILCE